MEKMKKNMSFKIDLKEAKYQRRNSRIRHQALEGFSVLKNVNFFKMDYKNVIHPL
jgi:hypothetical protein